ncbi:hypothetical protein Nwi_0499 [Nitrobacter winogradskyi Nb-255]|uniref:Uncharacterized protein n=1 Tax=Nitrobacter winogradskyi (strain ATCC 25391 / DSM 10237 / CIP 104748 / NCIMB 11846 / Nb-255) TaxID=323098 RepID=Q3SVC5_NITWN|nr:hypothetical protein Nwi_0499 [Nitrobacter winogradskyi Nb-255]
MLAGAQCSGTTHSPQGGTDDDNHGNRPDIWDRRQCRAAGPRQRDKIHGIPANISRRAGEASACSAFRARHDVFFIAQLIAIAEHCPQTRIFRRASPQVAQAAYHSTGERKQVGARTGPRLLRVI